ncbi:hypothetical protein CC2G_012706 [Coprinopsis cinerea AmutBmut pab1-1]|nr:hypothetical protein CC2G_012706 [Coprinopsis cinerea AmutBmut pab1-1]
MWTSKPERVVVATVGIFLLIALTIGCLVWIFRSVYRISPAPRASVPVSAAGAAVRSGERGSSQFSGSAVARFLSRGNGSLSPGQEEVRLPLPAVSVRSALVLGKTSH